MTPIYFPGRLYEDNKKSLLKLYEQFGVGWNPDEKAWIGEKGKVKGVFEGFKKPALLHVEGSEEFVNSISEFCKSIGAEVRDAEIKDIRDTRKEEAEEKKRQKEVLLIKEKEAESQKEESDRELKLAQLSVVQGKLIAMRRAGMTDENIELWIKKEIGAEIEISGDDVNIILWGVPDPYSKEDLYKEIEDKNKSREPKEEKKVAKKSAKKETIDEPKKEVWFDQKKLLSDE